MVKIDFFRKDGYIVKGEFNGHAEFSEGDDIVCASASSVAFAILNGIENVLDLCFGYETGDGYLFFVLPGDMNKEMSDKVNILTETLFLFAKELESQYPANVKVTELEV